jgi:23S rRNA (uracil1939-C5)-methyltransferase
LLLTIEKLVYGGDGLARMPDGRAVFLPFVLEGEKVEGEILEEKRSFVRAQAHHVLSASAERVDAACPYFQRCGGCHYQHANYEHQLAMKSAVLRETLRRQGKLEWSGEIQLHPSPPWHYRNRTRMQVQREPDFSLAYFRFASHELLPIEQCPISSPLINRAVAAINQAGANGGIPASIREIESFANDADARLMLELYTTEPTPKRPDYESCFRDLQITLPELASAAVFAAPTRPNADHSAFVFGDPDLTYRTATDSYHVSPGAFFQTNRHLTETLIDLVTRDITRDRRGKLAVDLYAGVGLFTLPLARNFEKVIAVEAAPISAADLRRNAGVPGELGFGSLGWNAGVPGEPGFGSLGWNAGERIRVLNQTTESFLATKTKRAPDYVVVDPPRAGLGERIARQLAELGAPHLTYVSCDPATLARDLRILLASGYRAGAIHLVDLFPQTFHIETVVDLLR